MFTLSRPTDAQIADHLHRQQAHPFSYPEVGATRGVPPAGYHVDTHRVRLGHGPATFAAARDAVRAWKMFPPEMTRLCFPDRPIAAGTTVAVLCRAAWLWTLHSARIVYVIDETETTAVGAVDRFGFAYGTLPAHAEQGEERFLVEWQHADDAVWYEILAFSRPRHWLAKLANPYVRHLQRRFRELSGEAMQRAVAEEKTTVRKII